MDKVSREEEQGELTGVLMLSAFPLSISQDWITEQKGRGVAYMFHKPHTTEGEKLLVICELCDAGGLVIQ